MKRLTKWIDPAPKNDCFPYSDSASQYTTKDKKAAINKLGKLEDIEKEIGCSILDIFTALKDGIFVKIKSWGVYHDYVILLDTDDGLAFRLVDFDLKYYLSDRNKTWALTKEELKEEK